METSSATDERSDRAGGYALAFGVAACMCVLIPVIGDLLAILMAVPAIFAGYVGVGRRDAGRTPGMLSAAIGAGLGACALFLGAMVLIATYV